MGGAKIEKIYTPESLAETDGRLVGVVACKRCHEQHHKVCPALPFFNCMADQALVLPVMLQCEKARPCAECVKRRVECVVSFLVDSVGDRVRKKMLTQSLGKGLISPRPLSFIVINNTKNEVQTGFASWSCPVGMFQ